MLNLNRFKFVNDHPDACPVYLLEAGSVDGWLSDQPNSIKNWVKVHKFTGMAGEVCLLPDESGNISFVLVGLGNKKSRLRNRFVFGGASRKLPALTYKIASKHSDEDLEEHYLGWLLSQYNFSRYNKKEDKLVQLVKSEKIDSQRIEIIAEGEKLTRDLINTPTNDMGPEELEVSIRCLADIHGANIKAVKGDELLSQNFPMIHAVGRASASAPRLLDLSWGESGPSLVLVGKGVCFDTGGLNIKPGSSMGLMKKDMGGAATVLGLAHMIMGLKLPIKLRVLIPAVENSISESSFRPQDILVSRKGLTVEINNTDAEGRLVLADALAYADEDSPNLIVCMATLTGAARVAVGPDLAPFFTDDIILADALNLSARKVKDPVWQLPFHEPYEALIEPEIADLDNAPSGGFAGSITAALFLRRFIEKSKSFVHLDIYGWQESAAPGRPKGGMGMGSRALLGSLPEILGL